MIKEWETPEYLEKHSKSKHHTTMIPTTIRNYRISADINIYK